MSRTAVILFNLGGPDSPEAVKPFLFNLFNDPAIIRLPNPFRWLLAQLISTRRAPVAREIYANIGGRSPLLPETEAQARALEQALAGIGEVRAFPCMRYWHPLSDAVVAEVKAFGADEIVLLPLYPQFSTTTSDSSLKDWRQAASAAGLNAPTRTVCCYPTEDGFIAAQAKLIAESWSIASAQGPTRLLFSAHGLPEKVIADGDPYQWQVERTCAAIAAYLTQQGIADLDWQTCYQSRVGPMKWIGPSTDDEIVRAGREGRGVVVVPVAFVSEHSETLVELDIEYRELAQHNNVPHYLRVATVGVTEDFIAGLARVVCQALDRPENSVQPLDGGRICPAQFGGCICRGDAVTSAKAAA